MYAFATFFLLSYVKFFSVSIDILTQANVWDVYDMQQHPVLYYDGTVEYFGREHIPFAILAVCVLILFTFLPILVLSIYYIYPCRRFQRRLDRCHINSLAVHWLMDTFQGYYQDDKDGTNGTRDCRCFAAMFLILRILVNTGPGEMGRLGQLGPPHFLIARNHPRRAHACAYAYRVHI